MSSSLTSVSITLNLQSLCNDLFLEELIALRDSAHKRINESKENEYNRIGN
jgi:hypothetical protein